MKYYVYVLYSKKYDKIYIGYTSNLEVRMSYHNETARKGYTKRYRPWEVLYKEEYKTKLEALKREKQLKGGQGRSWFKHTLLKPLSYYLFDKNFSLLIWH